MAQTLFERYGGFARVSKFVMAFYDRVVESAVIGHHFDGVSMRRLIDHQTQFVAQLMGGPQVFSDETLRHVHAHLAIDDVAFDEMLALFRETLDDFAFGAADADAMVQGLEDKRHLIVGAPAARPIAAP